MNNRANFTQGPDPTAEQSADFLDSGRFAQGDFVFPRGRNRPIGIPIWMPCRIGKDQSKIWNIDLFSFELRTAHFDVEDHGL